MQDDTSDSPARGAKPESTSRYTEAELSRIAREAVHQEPDARLDKELARLGLVDDSEAPEPPTHPATPPVAIDPELERLRNEYASLRAELDRSIMIVRLLIGVLAVLAIVVVVLLVR
jgi:hypothetical protein